MDWCDIDDILISGTEEKILKLKCPDCCSKIKYRYNEKSHSMEIRCDGCGYLSRMNNYPYPNCVELFGAEAIV